MYSIICGFLFFTQENIIFRPDKLPQDFVYQFNQPFEELYIPTKNKETLNALLFNTSSSKELIFFLHGNGGALDSWGSISKTYTDLGYDLLIIDYKGYGKNKGKYSNQKELFQDIQKAYDFAKQRYSEEQITIVGYSLGSGISAHLAANNQPKQLILMAPYHSLIHLMHKFYPIIPSFILKYKFNTFEYIRAVKCPITIFQGAEDHEDFIESALLLKPLLHPNSKYVILPNQGHNGMCENIDYKNELKKLRSN